MNVKTIIYGIINTDKIQDFKCMKSKLEISVNKLNEVFDSQTSVVIMTNSLLRSIGMKQPDPVIEILDVEKLSSLMDNKNITTMCKWNIYILSNFIYYCPYNII